MTAEVINMAGVLEGRRAEARRSDLTRKLNLIADIGGKRSSNETEWGRLAAGLPLNELDGNDQSPRDGA